MGVLILLLTTVIWGTAFLAQKFSAASLGPVTVTVVRNVLGGAFLLGLVALRRQPSDPVRRRRSVAAGVLCGVPLFAAMLAQQIGIAHTSPGVSAFLTANYVLFVPLFAAVLRRRLPRVGVLAGALVALAGTYLICIDPARPLAFLALGPGEAWTLLCAVLFAVQMLVVDRHASASDLLVMSAAQLFTCSILGAPLMLLASERAALAAAPLASSGVILPIVYLGVFSSGIAYTLQNVGQARTPPALAAIVLSLESVFGALSGWIALGDRLSPCQATGCALVFAAVLMASLLDRRESA